MIDLSIALENRYLCNDKNQQLKIKLNLWRKNTSILTLQVK